MASSYTTNITLEKPTPGEQSGEWGTTLNANFDKIDTKLAIKDEDNMASDSASHLATQQSIKAYVDSQVATDESIEDVAGGMVTGNTETGIAVTYEDGDGTLDFVVSDTTVAGDSGSTGITPGDTLTIAGGTNVTTAMSGDTLTVTSTDTNTQLTQEQVEDFVGGMVTGNTETGITVTYQDADGTLDFVVSGASALAADDLTEGDAAVTLSTSSGNITIDATANDSDIIFKGTDNTADITMLTLDGSEAGAATFNSSVAVGGEVTGVTSLNAGQLSGRRNFIYNGDMQICQRSTSVTGIGNGDSGYHVQDRWLFYEAGAPNAVLTQSRSTTAPDGFYSSLKFLTTTNSGTVASGDVMYLAQILEGQDLQSWNKGDAQAKSVTVSFWVNATQTGTYICRLFANARHISRAYTISSADTWEYKTLTFPGDTSTAFPNSAATALYIQWWLVAGTDWTSGTLATSWVVSTTIANAVVGQVDAFDDDDDMFHLTGVQLELGDTATAFEYEGYGENLARCQRYFNFGEDLLYGGFGEGGGAQYANWQFPTTMRADPTVTGVNAGSTAQNVSKNKVDCYRTSGYVWFNVNRTADAELT
jgi:hypothetical protein